MKKSHSMINVSSAPGGFFQTNNNKQVTDKCPVVEVKTSVNEMMVPQTSGDVSGQYEDPTMILSKSRVTIGLLGLVILTLSTMMIFVILSVRIEEKIGGEQPLYVFSGFYLVSMCVIIIIFQFRSRQHQGWGKSFVLRRQTHHPFFMNSLSLTTIMDQGK